MPELRANPIVYTSYLLSISVMLEPALGVKQNLRLIYEQMQTKYLLNNPHWAYKSLTYVLAFFHVVIQVCVRRNCTSK